MSYKNFPLIVGGRGFGKVAAMKARIKELERDNALLHKKLAESELKVKEPEAAMCGGNPDNCRCPYHTRLRISGGDPEAMELIKAYESKGLICVNSLELCLCARHTAGRIIKRNEKPVN